MYDSCCADRQTVQMKSLGTRLKAFRTQARLTQEQVAEEVGLTKATVSNWETDVSRPDIPSLIVLRKLYGVTLDVLICGDSPEGEGLLLSASERNLIQRFRSLPPKKREAALNLLAL